MKETVEEKEAGYRKRLEEEILLRKQYEEKYRALRDIVKRPSTPLQKYAISQDPYHIKTADLVRINMREFVLRKIRWRLETFFLKRKPLRYWAPVFDPADYAAKYPELAATCHYSKRKLLEHFLEHGIYEGREGKKGVDLNRLYSYCRDDVEIHGHDLRRICILYAESGRKKGLTGLYRWATADKGRKKVLSALYLLCGRYIPAVRRIGDRVIFAEKNKGQELPQNARDTIAPLDRAMSAGRPLVSVIVPNYNHAPYLKKRLESIYGQTYTNIEVILLDDASEDESVSILEHYRSRYPEKTRLIRNAKNSGKVFVQWYRGMSIARGEYLWIAESDDWCDRDFLEKTVPELERQSVQLVVAHTWFVEKGIRTWSAEEYLRDTDTDWRDSFRMTAREAVRRGFAVQNLIPNVSAVLFRNPGKIPEDFRKRWESMELCGDWLFYLFLLRGGAISYVRQTNDFYRIHSGSTSTSIQHTERYFRETEAVSEYIAENYPVEPAVFEKTAVRLKKHFAKLWPGRDTGAVDHWYSPVKIREKMKKRLPHVLMGCFSLQSGGGEIFPIHLANALWDMGITVTFLNAGLENYEEGVRRLLHPGIPLVNLTMPSLFGETVRAYGANVVHTHHASVDSLAAIYVRDRRIRHVITLHGMYEMMTRRELKEFLPTVCGHCDCFVYIAPKNLEPFHTMGFYKKCRFRQIANGIGARDAEAVPRRKLGIPEDAFVFCLVSRALFSKGWSEAVQAVKRAGRKCRRPVHLILIGSGEAYEEIRRDTDPQIHALGHQDLPQRYFKTADMGLLPSRYTGESFPLAVLECLMCGRPVLATRVGEIPAILAEGTGHPAGLTIPLHHGGIDVEELAECMVRIAEDPVLYERLKGNAGEAAAPYDIRNTAREYRKVYTGE